QGNAGRRPSRTPGLLANEETHYSIMQLSISQHMKMSQQMKLAPRMIQSMEILQLPIMALKERIEQELAENPILEEPVTESDAPDAPSADFDSEPGIDAELAALEPAVATKAVEQQELVIDNDHNNQA